MYSVEKFLRLNLNGVIIDKCHPLFISFLLTRFHLSFLTVYFLENLGILDEDTRIYRFINILNTYITNLWFLYTFPRLTEKFFKNL